jgi:alginate O-acetyltransferase complex protein AlgI
MVFTSINFLVFFTALLALFFLIRKAVYRQYLLLIASYIFYGAWNPSYLILIAFCSVLCWWTGILIYNAENQRQRKIYMIFSVSVCLGVLGFFKYANFFTDNIVNLFNLDIQRWNIILPVGISFFTFQSMSYTIDLYRNDVPICKSLMKFMLFVAFFPQLVAGPIVRARDFLPQLEKPVVLTRENIIIGSQIFLGGALQKVLIADNISVFVDAVFEEPSLYNAPTLWLALISYSIQIFCDFCGYSLMAIGVSRIFGFKLMENFRMPYVSISITEFWRRWHISLSFWLRDYLYISLGGNRKGELRTKINLLITMVLGGLWHGASWNFVLWGALHGLGLIVHKYWANIRLPFRERFLYKLFSWVMTYGFVVMCWLPFRSQNFNSTYYYLQRMFNPSTVGVNWMFPTSLILIAITIAWHVAYKANLPWLLSYPRSTIMSFRTMTVVFSCLMLIVLFAPLNTSPFIYFQF